MATLAALGAAPTTSVIRVLSFEESPILNSEGLAYFELKLKEPVQVGCSTDMTLEKAPFDVLYCLPEHVNSDKWEGTKEDGFFIPGFVVDFAKSHMVALYQPETILAWARGQRQVKKTEKSSKIADMLAARRKAGK